MWNVKVFDYGLNEEDEYFVTYRINNLDEETLDYLLNTLEGKITVVDDTLIFDVIFPEKIFPFISEESKIKPEDFIAREEIEMTYFIASLLDDMK